MSAIAPSHRWYEQQIQVERFVGRFEESYRLLVYHAALPLVLTPELLNYLRTQFLPREQVPWIAEVDLLLSDLCRPVGYELYAMDTHIRAYVLAEIQDDPFWQQRMRDVAQVLISYVNYLSQMHPGQRQAELEAQRWAALVYLGDEPCRTAVREIAERLHHNNHIITQEVNHEARVRSELARLTRITQELEPQLRENETLVEYARLVQRVLRAPNTVRAEELRRCFEVEGIELSIAEPFFPEALRHPEANLLEQEADLVGFPPLLPLEFESAAIVVLPTWKQVILDSLRNWVRTYNQLKKNPSLARRVTTYQDSFEALRNSLESPDIVSFLEQTLHQRTQLLQHPDHLQPEDFQRTRQLLSAFLRRHTETILPDDLSLFSAQAEDFPADVPGLCDRLTTFAEALPQQLEATRTLPHHLKTTTRQGLERSFLQTVGGLALVIVSNSLSSQDASKALLLGYFLIIHGIQDWPEAAISQTTASNASLFSQELAPATDPEMEEDTPFPPLHPFAFQVATLHAATTGWVIHREHQQAYQFIEDLGEGIALEMVAIPAGQFSMGSPEQEAGRSQHEGPMHRVSVPGFYLGKYAVTQTQWRTVAALPPIERELNPNPSHTTGAGHPVEQVNWYEVMEFCQRLSQKTGHVYRLPTEAEWEYACRAETTTPFHFGPIITSELANYRGRTEPGIEWPSFYANGPAGLDRGTTTPVDAFGVANRFGLSDMHGNVWEWCLDPWHTTYQGAPTDGRPWLTEGEGAPYVLRGGSWIDPPQNVRSASRNLNFPGDRLSRVGFRVVCELPAAAWEVAE